MTEKASEKTFAIFGSSRNRKLIEKLRGQNHTVLELPPIDFALNILNENDAETVRNFSRFDWLVFPNARAVEFFLETAETNAVDLFELDEKRVCAFGEAAADRLRFVQIHTDVIPLRNSGDAVYQAIAEYVSDETAIVSAEFLIFKRTGEKIELSEKFAELGVAFREIEIYRAEQSKQLKNEEIAKLKALLVGGAVDEMIFTSPPEVENLQVLLERENPEAVLAATRVSATDEATRQTLIENGVACFITKI